MALKIQKLWRIGEEQLLELKAKGVVEHIMLSDVIFGISACGKYYLGMHNVGIRRDNKILLDSINNSEYDRMWHPHKDLLDNLVWKNIYTLATEGELGYPVYHTTVQIRVSRWDIIDL